ncbi:histidine--tRNA ligase [Fusobacterium sp. IOR10]|uniref:histidine--tRNA ligase n=1 Tax=Fusobacterium sp. IOR10 TaxID=2665157 RepID=UPI0013D22889|nr:histidine--tRNA ligase [Fusobacterium sp. IOR10]
MKLIKAVRGTKDILGETGTKYAYINRIVEELFNSYGYSLIKTPIFEETDLFKRGIGEATDVVEKEMYTFKDRGDRSLTLRPEGTASVVRAYLENKIYAREELSKFYYMGSMFRYERPQAGRQREFNQVGVEVLGESSPLLDAEVISMGYHLLEKLGITDLAVTINSIGGNDSRVKYRKALIDYLTPIREELCEDCQRRFETNPLRVLDCKNETCKKHTETAPSIIDSLSPEEKDHYETVKKYLTLYNVPFVENPKLVRGLDYYSSTVFEIVTNKLGSQGTVLGGGRYDGLLKQLGDKDIPAFGFAAGVERMMMLLDDMKQKETDAYIIWLGEESREYAMKTADTLRKAGIRLAIDFNKKGMRSHMKKAEKLAVNYAIIIGGDEIEKNTVIVKNFLDRTQEELTVEQAIERIKK